MLQFHIVSYSFHCQELDRLSTSQLVALQPESSLLSNLIRALDAFQKLEFAQLGREVQNDFGVLPFMAFYGTAK